MRKHIVRRYIDIAMYFIMCFVAGTGLLIGYRLPPCSKGGDSGHALWGFGRHDWGTWHLWAAYALLALCVIHLVLNFAFIKNVVASKSRSILAGITIAGAAIVLWFLFVPVEVRDDGEKCGTSGTSCSDCSSKTSCNLENQKLPVGADLPANANNE